MIYASIFRHHCLYIDPFPPPLLCTLSQLNNAVLKRHGGFVKMLLHHFPHYPWEPNRFKSGSLAVSKFQKQLYDSVQLLFPDEDISLNYSHPQLLYSNTNRMMELDIYIERIKLIFEAQGEQHYKWHFLFGNPEVQKKRDREKKTTCEQAGYTVINVSYLLILT